MVGIRRIHEHRRTYPNHEQGNRYDDRNDSGNIEQLRRETAALCRKGFFDFHNALYFTSELHKLFEYSMNFAFKSILKTLRLNSGLIFNQTLFAQDCVLCAAASGEQMLCPACQASLPHITHACPRCAAPGPQQICGECLQHPPAFDRSIAALEYGFPADKLIQTLKYGGQLALAKLLGELLADAVTQHAHPDALLPMPLHPARIKTRGFNQALEIARVASRRFNLPLSPALAQRVVDTTPQASLPIDARHKNIKGAFICDQNLHGQHIAVVDDVMTSGATLNELAKTLKRAGAAQVDVWVVARAIAHH